MTVIAAAAIISLASCGGNSSSEKTPAEKAVEYLEAAQDAMDVMDWKKNIEINNECAKWYFDLSYEDKKAVNEAADAWQKANKKPLTLFDQIIR